jgi:ABC-type multidrug transport system fused ATPase/permease subunit
LIVSPLLFAVVVGAVAPLMLAVVALARRAHRKVGEWGRSSRRFSAETQVRVRALGLTKVAGAEASELQGVTRSARDLTARYQAFQRSRAANAAVDASVAAVAGALVLVVGGIAVANHTTTLGGLLSFYAVLALLLRQVHVVAAQSNSVLVGLESLPRIEALLATPDDAPYVRGRRKLEFTGEIALEEVTFAFGEATVLRDVTFVIRASEHVAIVGPNGAGKSTLVSLVLGLYRPGRGELRADGVAYDELDIRSLRRQIGVVLQDPVLLPGTIRENIAYGRPEASDAEVRAAAEAATAAVFIDALPDGYATQVGDEAVGLSGGQRQRIALARALLGEPPLLILDEPTTYLDDAAVAELMARLAALPQAPTLLVVTHDPRVAVHAERVVELRDGRIAVAQAEGART